MIKIVAVSYINTLPYIYGIQNSGFLNKEEFKLERLYPSLCTKAFYDRSADIILIPSGSFDYLPNENIITSFCIASYQHVKSVLLVSKIPIDKLKKIWIDYQSTTSVKLLKILLKHYWKKDIELLNSKPGYEQEISDDTGGLIIGDRALELSKNYSFIYDLSFEWWKFVKLPFVYAFWVKTNPISEDFLFRFEKSLKWGVENKNSSLYSYSASEQQQYITYLEQNIIFSFNEEIIKGLVKFYDLLRS